VVAVLDALGVESALAVGTVAGR